LCAATDSHHGPSLLQRVMEVLPEVNVEPEVVLKQIFDPAMTPEQILKDTPKLIGRCES
jgi:hypothetical protein